MSCASRGNCSAGGEYDDAGTGQAFVVTETNGTWGKTEEIPGTATLNSGGLALVEAVSCASAGNCTAGGVYSAGSINDEQGFVVDEKNGTWDKAEEVPGLGHLNAGDTGGVGTLSCASPGNCSAGGNYLAASGNYEAFVSTETGGTWAKATEVPGTASLNTGGNANLESVSCALRGQLHRRRQLRRCPRQRGGSVLHRGRNQRHLGQRAEGARPDRAQR